MDVTYPEKYYRAAAYFDKIIGDIETTTKLDNERKLLFYALRRQAEEGPCTRSTPSLWHVTERYKHQAWCKLGRMSSCEAMVHFVRQFEAHLGGPVRWAEVGCDVGPETIDTASDDAVKRAPRTSVRKKDVCLSAALLNGDTLTPGVITPLLLTDRSTWDEDLRAHSSVNEDNIAYLVTQVMHARHLYKQAVLAGAPKDDANLTRRSARDGGIDACTTQHAEEIAEAQRAENASRVSQNVGTTSNGTETVTRVERGNSHATSCDISSERQTLQNIHPPCAVLSHSGIADAPPPVRNAEHNVAACVPRRHCVPNTSTPRPARITVPIAFAIRPPRRAVMTEQLHVTYTSSSLTTKVTAAASLPQAEAQKTSSEKSWVNWFI